MHAFSLIMIDMHTSMYIHRYALNEIHISVNIVTEQRAWCMCVGDK